MGRRFDHWFPCKRIVIIGTAVVSEGGAIIRRWVHQVHIMIRATIPRFLIIGAKDIYGTGSVYHYWEGTCLGSYW